MFKTVTQLLLTGEQNLFARDFIVLVIETSSLKASKKTQKIQCVYIICMFMYNI